MDSTLKLFGPILAVAVIMLIFTAIDWLDRDRDEH